MFADNPSYFSVAKNSEMPTGIQFMAHETSKMSNIERTLNQQLTPPRIVNHHTRNLRSCLLSMSLNSTSSNQELLIMGEPRLSDIAPDLAVSVSVPRESLINNSQLQEADLMYFPLPSPEEVAIKPVFCKDEMIASEGTARYYNFTPSMKMKQRRHSIGSFTMCDSVINFSSLSKNAKYNATNGTEQFSNNGSNGVASTNAHSITHESYAGKLCNRCKEGKFIIKFKSLSE